jgi:outer membrane usher protein
MRASREQDNSSQYVNLRPGFNIGAWRIRNYSTWNRSTTGNEEEQKFTSVYTYAQRDIVAMKSDLTVGQAPRLPTFLTAYPTPACS